MKNNPHTTSDHLLRYRFRFLLITSTLVIIALAWPTPPTWARWGSLCLLVLAAINTLRHRHLLQRLALGTGFVSLALLGADGVVHLPQALNDGLTLIVFYGLLAATLFHSVTSERPVTPELLYGLCALYLQIALAFAYGYQVVNGLIPGAFGLPDGSDALGLDTFIYYSLATLTTVGYGDIHALAPAARLLASAEAVTGVMFIAVSVARMLALMRDGDD